MADGPRTRRTPWRDNLEAMAMALIMAMFLKVFLIEAYRIPSGSMQPTLIGDDAMNVHDRILVDKLSFAFRDPERFEVCVFRYPLDRSKTFVKRAVGIGPEDLRIDRGDLWRRGGEDEEWSLLRRPRGAQSSAWKDVEPPLSDRPAWTIERGSEWTVGERSVQARGDGTARWRPELGAVLDRYWDGYSSALLATLERRRERGALHVVGDLRLEGSVTALAGTRAVVFELEENERTYRFRLPGPAAEPDARPSISVLAPLEAGPAASMTVESPTPWRLNAGRPVRLAAQNLDDRLELQLDGDWLLGVDVQSVAVAGSAARVRVEGEGADFDDLRLLRDVYYTSEGTNAAFWRIPAGEYFFLGDNTQDSSDSREWTFEQYEVPRLTADGGNGIERAVVRVGSRRGENPFTFGFGEPGGPTLGLRDEWGELAYYPLEATRRLAPESAPFVPRPMILGRAVAVFWPLDPRRGIYRLDWVR